MLMIRDEACPLVHFAARNVFDIVKLDSDYSGTVVVGQNFFLMFLFVRRVCMTLYEVIHYYFYYNAPCIVASR